MHRRLGFAGYSMFLSASCCWDSGRARNSMSSGIGAVLGMGGEPSSGDIDVGRSFVDWPRTVPLETPDLSPASVRDNRNS